MRKADKYCVFILSNLLLLGLMFAHATVTARANLASLAETAGIVQRLQLTDLSLANEAWHTRNPSQCDFHSPFQSHPLALEHFPTGAIITPAGKIKASHAPVD